MPTATTATSSRAPSTLALLAALAAVALGPVRVAGQEQEVEQHGLTFVSYEELGPGQYSLVEGTTGPVAHEFYADDLDIFQPVAVVLQAREPASPLRLELRSYSWTGPIRAATTDEEGRALLRVRTTPDLYVRVVAPDGSARRYQLAVWKGEPITAEAMAEQLAPAIVPASEEGAGGDGGEADPPSSVPWIVVLVGGALLATVTSVILRKRRAS